MMPAPVSIVIKTGYTAVSTMSMTFMAVIEGFCFERRGFLIFFIGKDLLWETFHFCETHFFINIAAQNEDNIYGVQSS